MKTYGSHWLRQFEANAKSRMRCGYWPITHQIRQRTKKLRKQSGRPRVRKQS